VVGRIIVTIIDVLIGSSATGENVIWDIAIYAIFIV
jgi:hypothetical protein